MARLRITIEVDYDDATVEDPEELKRFMRNKFERDISLGEMLDGPDPDGNGGPIVDEWHMEVERIAS